LRDMALAGMGIIRVSEFLVRGALRDGRLVPLLEAEHASEEVPVWAIMAPGRHRMPRIQAFVDYVAAAVGD
ncbi:MAG: LysR family transcriptional regulator, partial [Acetobacteraceae bacterium]